MRKYIYNPKRRQRDISQLAFKQNLKKKARLLQFDRIVPELLSMGVDRCPSSTVNCRRRLPKFPSTYRMQAAINTRARSRNVARPHNHNRAAYVSAQHASQQWTRVRHLPTPEQTLTRRPLGESLTRLLRDRGRGLDGDRVSAGTINFPLLFESRVFLLPLAFYDSRQVSIKEYDFQNRSILKFLRSSAMFRSNRNLPSFLRYFGI